MNAERELELPKLKSGDRVVVADVDAARSAARGLVEVGSMRQAECDNLVAAIERVEVFDVYVTLSGWLYGLALNGQPVGLWFPRSWLRRDDVDADDAAHNAGGKSLRVDVDAARNVATLSLVDSAGNGVILLAGQIGGCGFLSAAQQAERVDVLRKLTLPGDADAARLEYNAGVGDWVVVRGERIVDAMSWHGLEAGGRLEAEAWFANTHGGA